MQVPTAIKDAALPETVQMLVVEELKLTANPEVADAVSFKMVPTICGAITLNVIVCVPSTVNVCEADAGA